MDTMNQEANDPDYGLSLRDMQIRDQDTLNADMLAIIDQARADGRDRAADLIEAFYLGSL
jgi:hypothetical protein